MKPFDLEAALRGDKVVTRDGREVTEIYHFKTSSQRYPVRAVVAGGLSAYTVHGRLISNSDSAGDLFMAPKERTVWVNVWTSDSLPAGVGSMAHPTEDKARLAARNTAQDLSYVMIAHPTTIKED